MKVDLDELQVEHLCFWHYESAKQFKYWEKYPPKDETSEEMKESTDYHTGQWKRFRKLKGE